MLWQLQQSECCLVSQPARRVQHNADQVHRALPELRSSSAAHRAFTSTWRAQFAEARSDPRVDSGSHGRTFDLTTSNVDRPHGTQLRLRPNRLHQTLMSSLKKYTDQNEGQLIALIPC